MPIPSTRPQRCSRVGTSTNEGNGAGLPPSSPTAMTLTSWGVLLGLLVLAAIVVAAIVLIIRFVIRHRRGYDWRQLARTRSPELL